MQVDVRQIKDQVTAKTELVDRLTSELGKAIVGQENMVSRLLIGLLTRSAWRPGARRIGRSFSRAL